MCADVSLCTLFRTQSEHSSFLRRRTGVATSSPSERPIICSPAVRFQFAISSLAVRFEIACGPLSVSVSFQFACCMLSVRFWFAKCSLLVRIWVQEGLRVEAGGWKGE
ncbi:C2H2 finger domain transcription factor dvrA, partial [Frankliniella fusca]